MTHMFRAARQNRIFQDVVEQIQEAIIDGRLKHALLLEILTEKGVGTQIVEKK
jgi:acetylglutamate kinase